MTKSKLHRDDVAKYRAQQLKQQKGLCPLCGDKILPNEAVLDHDHETGHIRRVLHRQCNSVEGRVINWVRRTGRDVTPEQFLRNLIKYWNDDYSKNKIHCTHLTEQEKELKRLRKKLRTSKRASTKDKYRKLIQELQE